VSPEPACETFFPYMSKKYGAFLSNNVKRKIQREGRFEHSNITY
jgi:hypothetical protein